MISRPSSTQGLDIRYRPKTGVGPKRLGGIHLMQIVHYVALRNGALDKKYEQGPSLSDLIKTTDPLEAVSCGAIVRASIGYAWENFMARRVIGMDHQPGVLVWDGITGSPDGIEDSNGQQVIHEFKATWKSSAYPVTDQWMWMSQIMGYCYMLGMEIGELCNVAVIHPVYLCGDYRGHRDPIYRPTVLEFERKELEMNWQLMTQYRDCVMPEVW